MTTPKPSPRFKEYVQKILACGHWRSGGPNGSHGGLLIHSGTGETIVYQTHDGGNDLNSARNFAADAGKRCGCQFVEHRRRRPGKGRAQTTGFSITGEDNEDALSDLNDLLVRHDSLLSRLRSMATAPEWKKQALAGELVAVRAEIARYGVIPMEVA